jgi:hypothetical protein
MNLIVTLSSTSSLGETKVTPRAAAKHELLFNKPASAGSEVGLLNIKFKSDLSSTTKYDPNPTIDNFEISHT